MTDALAHGQGADASHDDDDDHGRLVISRRKVLGFAAFAVVAVVALYYLVPRLAGLEQTWDRIESGDPYWLLLALVFTIGSFAGYVAMFRGVFVRAGTRIGWRESYQITMSGNLAARVFAAGGAGGVVLTAWALRRSGMPARQVADKSVSFVALTYMVYAIALVVFGVGLRTGAFPGPAPFGVTVPPAVIGAAALAAGLAIAFVPTDFQRRVAPLAGGDGILARWTRRLANVPAAASAGIRDAVAHLGSRDPALLGALAYWVFQIAVLWAAFRAFGESPPLAVLVMGFFVGMFGNLLPMPGGVGGVEGGMIGALVAFKVEPGLAFVAVLVYRAFVFWLPMLPGVVAYFQLLRTVDRWREERSARPLARAGADMASPVA
jgi:uncharacterized membrane protein YbhN (UPF0104 family)